MKKLGIVTGGNRGLGLALVRKLCRDWGDTGSVYLTARDEAKGRAAVAELEAEGLRPLFHPLDLADEASVRALARHVETQHGGLDTLILNGAYAPLPGVPARDEARTMIETNNHGTYRMLQAFRPLLRDSARVVVIASGFGTLANLPPAVRPRFAGDLTMADVEQQMDDYVRAAEAGTAEAEGFPAWVNVPSKVGQVALMRAFARELQSDPSARRDIVVNAACPGWTWTDASRPYLEKMKDVEAKTPDEAAIDVIWLATLAPGTTAPCGELVQYRKIIPFEEGTVAGSDH